MAALTTALLAGGLALSAAGTALNYSAGKSQAQAQEQALAGQQQAEQLRQQQMNLDAERRKREVIRQSIAARSASVTAANSSGAMLGSGLPGAIGGVSGRSGTDMLAINQNQDIGNTMFGVNQNILGAYRSAAGYGEMAALGSGLTTMGNGILRNEGTISKVGTYLGSKFGFA